MTERATYLIGIPSSTEISTAQMMGIRGPLVDHGIRALIIDSPLSEVYEIRDGRLFRLPEAPEPAWSEDAPPIDYDGAVE